MDTRQCRFLITHHARERYVERFSRESRIFVHLSECKGCDQCRQLTFWLNDLVKQRRETWDRIIYAKLRDAEDVRVFHNNTNFMERMYEKYGYDSRFRFLVEGWILFVIKEDHGQYVVLTCMDVNNPVNGSRIIANFIHRPKYNKRVC